MSILLKANIVSYVHIDDWRRPPWPALLPRLSLRVRAAMSEEAVRQTRSQKRALERDHSTHVGSPGDGDSKRMKLEKGDAASATAGAAAVGGGAPLALVGHGAENVKLKSEHAAKVAASILKSGEVKATIKVELQTGDEPVDMSTSKRSEMNLKPATCDTCMKTWCSFILEAIKQSLMLQAVDGGEPLWQNMFKCPSETQMI